MLVHCAAEFSWLPATTKRRRQWLAEWTGNSVRCPMLMQDDPTAETQGAAAKS